MDEAKAAAAWWAQAIQHLKYENGDRSSSGGLIWITALANGLQELKKTKQTQIEGFANDLESMIEQMMNQGESIIRPVILGCDYGPDAPLLEIAEKHGISPLLFPWKTTMWIEPGEVQVSHGYGAPIEVIYAEPVDLKNQLLDELKLRLTLDHLNMTDGPTDE